MYMLDLDMGKFFVNKVKKNPDQKFILSNLGSKPYYVFVDPKLIKEFTLDKHSYYKKFLEGLFSDIFMD